MVFGDGGGFFSAGDVRWWLSGGEAVWAEALALCPSAFACEHEAVSSFRHVARDDGVCSEAKLCICPKFPVLVSHTRRFHLFQNNAFQIPLEGGSCSALRLQRVCSVRRPRATAAASGWCTCGKRSDPAKHVPLQLSQPRAPASRPRRHPPSPSTSSRRQGHHGAPAPRSITGTRRRAAAHTRHTRPKLNITHLDRTSRARALRPPICSRRRRRAP